MDREALQLMLRDGGSVAQICSESLSRGAEFQIWPEVTPASRIISIYTRRERTLRRTGQPSLGFESAVEDLRMYSGENLILGYVNDRRGGGYYFQLFLDADLESVVACLGVRQSSTVAND